MAASNDILKERVAHRLAELELTPRAASIRATGKPDLIRFINRRGVIPSYETLLNLSAVLETSVPYLMGETDEVLDETARKWIKIRTDTEVYNSAADETKGVLELASLEAELASVKAKLADERLNSYNAGRALPPEPDRGPVLSDIPVVRTGPLGSFSERARGDEMVEIPRTLIVTDDIIDSLPRPRSLANNQSIFGFYAVDESMAPLFDIGDPVIVDPIRAPSDRDYVLVYLDQINTDGQACILKRLIRRTSKYIEFEQFRPPAIFKVDVSDIRKLERVISPSQILLRR